VGAVAARRRGRHAHRIGAFNIHSVLAVVEAEQERTARQVASLEAIVAAIVEGTAFTSTDDEHDPEGATIAFERAQAYSMLEQAVRDRTALEDALARIDEDRDFGLCQRCASPIGLERLLALPATLLCVECAR